MWNLNIQASVDDALNQLCKNLRAYNNIILTIRDVDYIENFILEKIKEYEQQ